MAPNYNGTSFATWVSKPTNKKKNAQNIISALQLFKVSAFGTLTLSAEHI